MSPPGIDAPHFGMIPHENDCWSVQGIGTFASAARSAFRLQPFGVARSAPHAGRGQSCGNAGEHRLDDLRAGMDAHRPATRALHGKPEAAGYENTATPIITSAISRKIT
jgi:hypothetical protein